MSSCRKILLLICWMLLVNVANSQSAFKAGDRFGSLTEREGLSDNRIRCVLKDQNGFLWIGTAEGLNRFDGTLVQQFKFQPKDSTSISNNSITQLLEDRDGHIWIGTEGGGLNRFDPQTHSFIRYDKAQADEHSLSGLIIRTLYEDKLGRLWIGYRGIGQDLGGVSALDRRTGKFTHYLTRARDYGGFAIKADAILEDPLEENVLWLGGRSLLRLDTDTGKFTEFLHPNMVFNYGFVRDFLAFNDTTIWIASAYGGIVPIYTSTQTWGDFVYEGEAECMYRVNEKEIWIGEGQKGIGLLRTDDFTVNFYSRTPDDPYSILQDRDIRCIDLDNDGILWVGTGKGLTWKDPLRNRFSWFSLKEELPAYRSFKDILPLEDGYVLTTKAPQAILLLDRQFQFKSNLLSTTDYIDFVPECAITSSDGRILIGGNAGILVLDKATFSLELLPFKNRADFAEKPLIVYSLFEATNGDIWFGTTVQGLFKWNAKTHLLQQFKHEIQNPKSLCHDKYLFRLVADSKEQLWVATDKGLSVLDLKTTQFVSILEEEEKKVGPVIVDFLEKDAAGHVWIGTRDNGLYQYDFSAAQGQRMRSFTVADGLAYHGVNEMCLDPFGQLWLASAEGLTRLDVTQLQFTSFSEKDGLPPNCCTFTRFALDKDSTILSILSDGTLTRISPTTIPLDTTPPEIYLQSLKINGVPYSGKLTELPKTGLQLTYDENFFSLTFSAKEYTLAEEARYFYRLSGLEDNWVPTTPGATINYSKVEGGTYQFQLKAINKDGFERQPALQFSLDIGIPFWKQAWFVLTVLVGLLLITWTLYRYRIRQIRLREAFQAQIAEAEIMALRSQMNPHFIFNCLNALKFFIIENNVTAGTYYVNKFSKLVRMILEHSGSTLVPLESDWEALQLYVTLEEMRFENRITVHYDISPDLRNANIQVPPMLIQPFVENAIRHGLLNKKGPGNLSVQVSAAGELLRVVVEDDGIGRASSREMKANSQLNRLSLGIGITTKRMTMMSKLYGMKTHLEIIDKIGDDGEAKGTRVHLQLPLIKAESHV